MIIDRNAPLTTSDLITRVVEKLERQLMDLTVVAYNIKSVDYNFYIIVTAQMELIRNIEKTLLAVDLLLGDKKNV